MATIRLFKHYLKVPFLIIGTLEAAIFMVSLYVAILLLPFVEYFTVSPELKAAPILHGIIYTLAMLLGMIAVGLYQTRLRDGFTGIMLRIVTAFIFGEIILSVIFYTAQSIFIGRGAMIFTIFFSFIGVSTVRGFIYIFEPGIFRRRILILGAGEKARVITELRRKTDQSGFVIAGFVHLRGEHDVVDSERIVNLSAPLNEYAVLNDIDEIVLAVGDRRRALPVAELIDCKMSGIDVIDMLTFFERETGRIRLDQLYPSWLLFSDGFSRSAMRDYVKRIFDICFSLIFSIIISPLIVIFALLIKIEDGWNSPVFHRQVRVGIDGRPFHLLKLRSMRVDAEGDGVPRWASQNDSRVTKVGQFLRRYRIDELPQFINVILGDMSIVGPRAERPAFVGMLSDTIPFYQDRLRVRPGITGWAQLRYPYGASNSDASEKLQYDLYYVKNHSFFLDMLIVIQTAEVVLWGKGVR